MSHVCIHPWAAEGVEGGLRLHIGERVILQRSEGDWGMVSKQDSPKVGAMVKIDMAAFIRDGFQKRKKKLMEFSNKGPDPTSQHP